MKHTIDRTSFGLLIHKNITFKGLFVKKSPNAPLKPNFWLRHWLVILVINVLHLRNANESNVDPRPKRNANAGESGEVKRRRTHRDGRRRVQPDPDVYVADFNFNTTRG
jgi:hypothetical protein